ncbi:hypothetical protein H8E88_07415 [candidate division KSB1 bacterium]|nr:hypothetical protein [candidate division KSB1 bacterium]MBL7095938.1 hypothetical protein [candidate division KSB1 bacterium]
MSYYDYGFPRYVSVGEKKAKAAKKLAQLKKKNKDINPIVLNGSKLTNTWWGKAWNKNLEAYADYSNRIGRGRSYVRHGAVLDLKIQAGKVTALVQGTESRPYSVEIDIESIPKTKWNKIKKACQGKLASVAKLIDGKFPKELQEIFTEKGSGLFPKPSEINFDCSCPDWASMCKHVAAALYGIGSRLDENPSLFFILRKVKIDDLVSEVAKDKSKSMLSKAKTKTSRVIDDSDVSKMFGIDIDEEAEPISKKSVRRKTKGNKNKKK